MRARLKVFANGLDVGYERERENSRLTFRVLTGAVNSMELHFPSWTNSSGRRTESGSVACLVSDVLRWKDSFRSGAELFKLSAE